MSNVSFLVGRRFRKNQYACFAYTKDCGAVDIADGVVKEVDEDSLVINYDNVRGPATPTRIAFAAITECF